MKEKIEEGLGKDSLNWERVSYSSVPALIFSGALYGPPQRERTLLEEDKPEDPFAAFTSPESRLTALSPRVAPVVSQDGKTAYPRVVLDPDRE